LVCVYCPETDECYYVRPAVHGCSVTLRIAPSKNGQQAGVLDAAAFRELSPAFSADAGHETSP
jgi:PD-(D/E)XK endonuclease